MKLKFKIISIVVAIFLVIGLLFVFSDIRKTKDNPDTVPNEIQEEETTLFWSEADFNEIRLSNEGDDQEITLLKDEQGNWDTAEPLAEEVNLNKIDQAVSIIFSLSGHSKEVDLSTDEVFTAEEERSITLLNQSGIQEKLTIGKQNEEGTFYYVKLLESDEIYQVASQLIDALPSNQEDLYDRSVIEITSEQVRKMNIDNGVETYELAPVSPYTEEEARTNLSGWYMYDHYNNIYSVKYNPMSEMIYGIKDIEWLEIIEDPDEDLATYGLADVHFKITFSSNDDEETILIGAPATTGSYYAKLEDDDRIFTVANTSLHPYSYQTFDLVEKFVKIIALDVLKQLDIQSPDGNYIITVEQGEGESTTESNALFTINDQQIEDEAFRDLYVAIVGLSVDQEVDDATYTTPEATMSYTIMDSENGEKEVVVELVPYDEEHYAVFLDKQVDFLVKKDEFTQMIENIDEHLK